MLPALAEVGRNISIAVGERVDEGYMGNKDIGYKGNKDIKDIRE